MTAQIRTLLDKRLEYARHDGEGFLEAAQNACLVASAERYYRVMCHGDEVKPVRPSRRDSYERLFQDSGVGRCLLELGQGRHEELRGRLLETAEAFARAGADVCVVYHTDADGAAETRRRVEAAGSRAAVAQADVGDPASVKALFELAQRELGVVDVLVNNAGVGMGEGKPVDELEDADLERILRVDLMGPLFCCREFIRSRKRHGGGGRIVNVSSVAQHLPTPESAPYGMAKVGLGSLARSLARELAEHRINVNNVAPGLIATPMTQGRLQDPQKRDASFEKIPWHRAGRPEEVARLILFLASDDGDYVTGQTWTMDGGLTMQWGGA